MKAKVLKTFSDAKKKIIYTPDQIIEISKARFEEIKTVEGEPLLELVEDNGSSGEGDQ